MSKTATFNQVIDSKSLKVSIPVTRLEKLIDRVDFLLENGNTVKALQILKPFLVDVKQSRVRITFVVRCNDTNASKIPEVGCFRGYRNDVVH